MSKQSAHTIYALSEPSTGIVHYIGISKNVQRRYREHCSCVGLNLHKNIWIQELLQKNQRPVLTVIEAAQTREIALEREKVWIHHYLDLGLPLTNWNENKAIRNGGTRIDIPELAALAYAEIMEGRHE